MTGISPNVPQPSPIGAPYRAAFSSAGERHSVFHGPTWTDGMATPVLDSQTIVLPKGISEQELYAGKLDPEAGHSDAVKSAFAEAHSKYTEFLGSERNADLTGESLSHKVSDNHDGTKAVNVKRLTVTQQTLQGHYHHLRDAGIPTSVAAARTAAFAHNKSVRGLANLARLHPTAATAVAIAVVATAVAALAAPPREKKRSR